MTKQALILVALLQAIVTSQAVVCDGDSSNSCNGVVNTCTSEGLCVIDTSTGNCCPLSKPYGWNGCNSDENVEVCEGEMGVAYVEDDSPSINETAASAVTTASPTTPRPTLQPTAEPTPVPTSPPSKPPTPSPTPSPTAMPTTSSSPTETCYKIEIGLIFDQYPDETRWEITKGRRNSIENTNAHVLRESPYYDPDQGYVEASETHIICLPEGKYTYTMMDRNKDGMCCGNGEGRYAVTYKETGDIITQGSEFELFESTTFQIPFVTPQLRDADNDGIEDRTKNVIPPVILTPNGLPEICENEFGLHLQTDDYGVETTWELRERSTTGKYQDGKVIASGGPYTSDFTYDISYCLYPGKYTFVFYDWQCDGLTGKKLTGYYSLKINGNEVHRGGTTMEKYWEEVKLEFKKEVESVESVLIKASVEESSTLMVKITWMHALTLAAVVVMLA
eukprot:CAMPEP_0172572586 /NCGR_PEP_ID=MMETSP1067-20121228/135578_1 /TAXON_ID=265564 ORGANISM="Thalassiosira punctigera, Strain Tpunct2005C2" /NCGR_SAMPLE_ID=MMETSP1067 /ASSEMBLY_ACC=CAM_ASM_000444 /LENGTH=448 /DNA_ID=CAMNT_0013365153 /DNA_START=11 /DNA_END=1357 /DNA_ORIENTATION=+